MENTDQSPYQVSGPNPAEAAARYGSVFDGYDGVAETDIEVDPLSQSVDTQANTIDYRPMSDDLSFGRAFAAARAELGPGGAFSWRGQVYGTYYKSEWDSMTDDARHEFTRAAFEARDAFDNSSDPLLADVDFDDAAEVSVVGDADVDILSDSDTAWIIDVADSDMDQTFDL